MNKTESGENPKLNKPYERDKGGRPRHHQETLKSKTLKIHVTPEQVELINLFRVRKTNGDKQKMSLFLLNQILALAEVELSDSTARHLALTEEQSKALRKVRFQLDQIKDQLTPVASNYNQAVRRINSVQTDYEIWQENEKSRLQFTELLAILEALKTEIQTIAQLLNYIH